MLVSYCLSWPDLVFDIRHQYATVFASLHFCSVRLSLSELGPWAQEYEVNPIFVDDDVTWRWAAAQEYWFERVSAELRHQDRCQQARGRWLGRCGLASCNTNLFWVVLWPGCSHARKLDETRAAMRTIKKITCDETSSTSYFSFMIIQPCDVWGSASPWSKKSFRRTP